MRGADDGIRTRDPHLGKASNTPAEDRSNRWSPGHGGASTARDRWNRWRPLHWSSRWSSKKRVEFVRVFVAPMPRPSAHVIGRDGGTSRCAFLK